MSPLSARVSVMALGFLVFAAGLCGCWGYSRALEKDTICLDGSYKQTSTSASTYIASIVRQLDQLRSRHDEEDGSHNSSAASVSAHSELAKLQLSVNPFHDAWKVLEKQPSIKTKLCDADKLAKIDCETSDYPSNCKEFCGKLKSVVGEKQNVVGTFPRCAARIDKKAALAFSSIANATDGCWMTPFSQAGFMKFWEMYQEGMVILVMGQGLNPDGSAPPTLKRRAELAAELYKNLQIPVIVSGGDDRATGMTEAMGLARVMHDDFGVPYEAMIYEAQATTTLENFWYAFRQIRRLMHPDKLLKIFLVTHDWHMPRASYFGKVAARYFKTMNKQHASLKFFSNLDVQIEEVVVKSYCSKDPNASKDVVMGENTQSFASKCRAEENALLNHITGPERVSVGEESLDNNVWGTYLDPLESTLQEHRDRIAKLRKWTEDKGCTALPDLEKGETYTDEVLTRVFRA